MIVQFDGDVLGVRRGKEDAGAGSVHQQFNDIAVHGIRNGLRQGGIADRADLGDRVADDPIFTALNGTFAGSDVFCIRFHSICAAGDEAGLVSPGPDPVKKQTIRDLNIIGAVAAKAYITVKGAAGNADGTVPGAGTVQGIHANDGAAVNNDIGVCTGHHLDAHVRIILVTGVMADRAAVNSDRTAVAIEHTDRGSLLCIDYAAVDSNLAGGIVIDRVGRAARAGVVERTAVND